MNRLAAIRLAAWVLIGPCGVAAHAQTSDPLTFTGVVGAVEAEPNLRFPSHPSMLVLNLLDGHNDRIALCNMAPLLWEAAIATTNAQADAIQRIALESQSAKTLVTLVASEDTTDSDGMYCGIKSLTAYMAGSQLYVALNPGRLLDTRVGAGYTTIDGTEQGTGPVAPSSTFWLPTAGRAGIPSAVRAVALNVTPVNPSSPGYFTLWSGIVATPNSSNLNLNPGHTIPNLVISPVANDGSVGIFNGSSAAQDVVVDVQGYFPVSSGYVPMTPQRYLDTRSGYATVDRRYQAIGALANGGRLDLGIAGRTSIPAAAVGAVVFNLTAVQPTGTGFVTAWPSGAAQPDASNLNLNTGLTIPNLVISGMSSGQVSLYNGSATAATDLVADVQGWFPSNSGYAALTPARLLDTRSGQSTIDGQYAGVGALAADGSLNLQVTGRGGVPVAGAGTAVLNVTAVLPSQAGYITIWPTGSAQPLASNLNLNPGATIPNLVLAKIGSDGKVSIFNGSQAPTDILVDVQGWLPGDH